MPISAETDLVARNDRRTVPVVAAMLLGGLLGHVAAAQLMGGSGTAYFHHIGGFFLIAAITGLPIAGLTFLFWRRQRNRALLAFALIQLVLGILVMIGQLRKG